MIYYWALIGDQTKKNPVAIVVHKAQNAPKWSEVDKSMNAVFTALFNREKVFCNVPQGDGNYRRESRTWADSDYIPFAIVKVNLPLYVVKRGQYDCNFTDDNDVLIDLESKFLDVEVGDG